MFLSGKNRHPLYNSKTKQYCWQSSYVDGFDYEYTIPNYIYCVLEYKDINNSNLKKFYSSKKGAYIALYKAICKFYKNELKLVK